MFTVYDSFVTYRLVTLVAFEGFLVSATYNYIITKWWKTFKRPNGSKNNFNPLSMVIVVYTPQLPYWAKSGCMYFFHSIHVWELLRPQDIVNDVFNGFCASRWHPHTDGCKIIWPASFYGCNLLKPGYTSTCFTMATTLCSIGMMLTPDLIKKNRQKLICTYECCI